MSSPVPRPRSAEPERQAQLWSRCARDWADVQEPQAVPLYAAAIGRMGLRAGLRVLDAGCGAGLLTRILSAAGARTTGIDVAPGLLAIAEERGPKGAFARAPLEAIPAPAHAFDVVLVLNALHFTPDAVAALTEVRRVCAPGGRVVLATWDDPEDSEAALYVQALRQFLPPPPRDAGYAGPSRLTRMAVIDEHLRAAGLGPARWERVDCPFRYRTLDEALRGLLSAGPAVEAIEHAGREDVRRAVAEVVRRFRTDGGYELANRFRLTVVPAL